MPAGDGVTGFLFLISHARRRQRVEGKNSDQSTRRTCSAIGGEDFSLLRRCMHSACDICFCSACQAP